MLSDMSCPFAKVYLDKYKVKHCSNYRLCSYVARRCYSHLFDIEECVVNEVSE